MNEWSLRFCYSTQPSPILPLPGWVQHCGPIIRPDDLNDVSLYTPSASVAGWSSFHGAVLIPSSFENRCSAIGSCRYEGMLSGVSMSGEVGIEAARSGRSVMTARFTSIACGEM